MEYILDDDVSLTDDYEMADDVLTDMADKIDKEAGAMVPH